MDRYILIDKDNIIRCIATEEGNLHQDKIASGMTKHLLLDKDYGSTFINIGDEISSKGEIIPRPENYSPLPEEFLLKAKIANEIYLMAVERLVDKKELSQQVLSSYKQTGRLP